MDGTQPGFDSLNNLGPAILITGWIGFGLSAIVVGLRLYVRLAITKSRLASHDWCMTSALLCNLISMCLEVPAVHYGIGRHQDTLTEMEIFHARKWVTFVEIFVVIAPALARIAVALLILAILAATWKYTRILLYFIIAIQAIENAMIVLELFLQCSKNVSALWDPRLDYFEYCIPLTFQTVLAYLSSAFNSLSDLLLTGIPAMVLLKLQMNLRNKLALVGLFALSLVAFAISIVKAIQNANLAAEDFTFAMAYLQIYILVECNVIIITGSATVLRPLWHRSSRSAYQGYGYEISGGHGTSRVTHNTYANGTQKAGAKGTHTHMSNLGDGTSEEYILDSTPGDGSSKRDILRTTAYGISYDRDQKMHDDPHLPDERIYPEHKQW